MFSQKAYLNAKGSPAVLNLTHDVKRCLGDSKIKSGLVHIISTQGTTAVMTMENDPELQKEYLHHIQAQFESADKTKLSRRSHTGANCFHHMAATVGLSLTLAFDQGRLLTSPFHDIIALDFDPSPGRREFVISVMGDAPAAQGGQGAR
ncbi:MAG: YjbQ family protein [Deltaproteobacteria bacterium]|nr:YjbQ family protein [Deltaproteobacteria bacterium]